MNKDLSSDYADRMNIKINQYQSLRRRAEILNRDNGGKPTREEEQLYREAMVVCKEIINANLSQPSTALKWKLQAEDCNAEIQRINDALRPPKPPVAEPPRGPEKEIRPVRQGTGTQAVSTHNWEPDALRSVNSVLTEKGLTNKNAMKEVPADTIESWFENPPKHTLKDVVGMDDQAEVLMEKAGDLDWSQTDLALGISPVQSFLFYGMPGCGKTYLIEAFAAEMAPKGFKYMKLSGGDIHQGLVGAAEKTVEVAFREAIDNEPCIIFFDEIEDVIVNKGGLHAEGHEKRLSTAFLQAFNMIVGENKRVIVMGATNFPNRLDEAALDRFKTLIRVPLPSCEVREKYFMGELKVLTLEDGFTYADMAEMTENYSFRDMKALLESIRVAIRKIATTEYSVYDAAGNVDKALTDQAASEAINEGRFILTRELFESEVKKYVLPDKTAIRAALDEFESRMQNHDIV